MVNGELVGVHVVRPVGVVLAAQRLSCGHGATAQASCAKGTPSDRQSGQPLKLLRFPGIENALPPREVLWDGASRLDHC